MHKNKNTRNLAKTTAVLVGVITIVFLMGYLIFQIIYSGNTPPSLQVSSSYNSTAKQYNVEVENTGDTTAETVTVNMQIVGEGRTIDTFTITLDYVPAKSKKDVVVSLPQGGSFKVNLELISIHYQLP